MDKHTPGPWKFDQAARYNDIRGPNGEAICNLFPEAGNGGVGYPTAIANARLIADTPQMLEALREIVEGKGEFSSDPFEHCRSTVDNMKAIARAAIAKSAE